MKAVVGVACWLSQSDIAASTLVVVTSAGHLDERFDGAEVSLGPGDVQVVHSLEIQSEVGSHTQAPGRFATPYPP